MDTGTNDEPIILGDAEELVLEVWPGGEKRAASYVWRGRKVGYRHWEPDGTLTMEYRIEDDVMHGPFRTWHENGQVSQESTYVHGREHGVARQFDEAGVLIGSYELDHGTGLDLWFVESGVLAEERHMKDGKRHGFERWWSGDNATVSQEGHYLDGLEHGIFREWNDRGRLRSGFPKYFVRQRKVQRREYLKACGADPTLPRFEARDNQPNRPLPSAVGLLCRDP
jgi:antitoxin component YwqK of YwqJK toxin-antitoxin module